MTVTLIPVAEINSGTRSHLSLSEAAKKLGCSESAIRRAARRAGVRKITGRTVRGGILIERYPAPIVITYSA
jgi:hypothetical protein